MNIGQTKVLHVLNELKPSGAESMLRAAHAEFLKNNVVGEILSTGAQVGPYAAQLLEAGYVIHHIPYSKSPAFFLKVFHLMKNGYDAIHVHTQRGNFWFGLIALLAVSGPVLRTIHSSFVFNGLLRIRTKLSRRTLQAFGVRHVAIGESVRRVETDLYGISPGVVSNWYNSAHYIPPTIEAKKAARTALGLSKNAFVITSVGNCAPVKNHPALIKALSLLPAEQRPLYLHVGQEDASCSEHQLAKQLGIEKWILFLGANSDVRTALYASDVFVMPSLREGFGIAAIEALACGLPCIFTDVDGLADFRMLYPRLIYCNTSAEDISKALRQVIEMSHEERDRLAQANAMISQKNFGIARGVEGYSALYSSGVSGK
jgi:glycosyltransferase involved in cell wall biosynthesis